MKLASRMGVALALTALVSASAFAESRPANKTRERQESRGSIRRGSPSQRPAVSRGDSSSNASRQREAVVDRRSQQRDRTGDDSQATAGGERSSRGSGRDRSNGGSRESDRYDRDRSSSNSGNRGSYDRGRENRSGRDGTWRGDSRSGRSSTSGRSNQHRQPHYASGRVSRVLRHGNGYRVWVHGAAYPFFIPLAYYRHDRFRIGLSIHLGGYYNQLGYYDYYDGSSSGAIRGVVESVDYRRDSFVIRNEATGSFVTVVARDRGLDVRAGDYVEMSGEWTRAGAFQAWDVDFLDDGYRR